MAHARLRRFLRMSFVIPGLLFSTSGKAQIIAKWTFESTAPVTAGPVPPEVGSGSLIGFHANPSATYSSPPGNGSSRSYNSNDWAAGDYYQFHVNTLGMNDIALSFEQTSSATGPKSFIIQTSADGINFTDLPSGNYDVGTNGWSGTASSYVQASKYYFPIAMLDNVPDAYVRLTLAAGNTSAGGGTIQGGGTSRLDNVSIGTSTALPLVLQDFNARSTPVGNLLVWKTATEKDIDYFSVEKSKDGQTFTEITKIKPVNNQLENDYNYTDISCNAFYRLNIYQRDGQSYFSRIVAVSSEGTSSDVFCPTNIIQDNQPLKLIFARGNLRYTIFNYQGRVLMKGQVNAESDGIDINVSKLSAGNYIIQTNLNGLSQSIRFLKK